MNKRVLFLAVFLFVLPLRAGAGRDFPRPAAMESQVRFWRAIFTDYSRYQVVLHDAADLDKIYAVLDFRAHGQELDPPALERLMREETDAGLARLRALFGRLHEAGPNPAGLSDDEQRLFALFRGDSSPDRFLAAADGKRLRSQRGLRERFAAGIRASRRYLPEMEAIFREAGVPLELTRLPLIESCFDVEAYSKVGAAGIWQFMPATARRYIAVGSAVDERRDPITATRAAARFLAHLHDRLGSWPLAITAYNHGPEGIVRATRALGTRDIDVIVRDYRGPAFGFASRNFYAEFIAALDVDRFHEAYFGPLQPETVPQADELLLGRAVGIEVAARLAATDRETIASLNPALMSPVVEGRLPIPRGYRLRLPQERVAGFATRLAMLEDEVRVTRARAAASEGSAVVTHRVRRGQTLSQIAARYGVSVRSLLAANRLRNRSVVRAGQVLRIPRSA
jgi:membrane-bound lytic murein transglycosylase D